MDLGSTGLQDPSTYSEPQSLAQTALYINCVTGPGNSSPSNINHPQVSEGVSSEDYMDLGAREPQQPSTYTELQPPPQTALYVNSVTGQGNSSPSNINHPQVSEGVSSGDYMDLGVRDQDPSSTYTELQSQTRV